MSFLPVVERELRIASRKRATYRLRWMTGGAAFLIWVALLATLPNSATPTAAGVWLMWALGILALSVCLATGVLLTSDCISEERREGTLGLLFLTDLRGYDVVLGKLASRSVVAAFTLLSIVPILGLPLLTGGITPGEFWRMILVLAETLFLSLAVGLVVSVHCRDARRALGLGLLVMLLIAGLPWLVEWVLVGLTGQSAPAAVMLPSPIFAFRRIHAVSFAVSPQIYWNSVAMIAGLGAAAVVWASVALPRIWRRAEAGQGRNRQRPVRAVGAARANQLTASQRRWMLERNPFLWLAARGGSFPKFTNAVVAVISLLSMAFLALSFLTDKKNEFYIGGFCLAFGAHVLFKSMLAAESVRRLNEDRRSGSLEQVLATPLAVAKILSGLRRALLLRFRFSLVALTAGNIALAIGTILNREGYGMPKGTVAVFVAAYAGGILHLWLDYHAISWHGIRAGLTKPKPTKAVLATLNRALLPAWIGIFFLVFFTMAGGVNSDEEAFGCWAIWMLFTVAIGCITLSSAQSDLRHRFRDLATRAAR